MKKSCLITVLGILVAAAAFAQEETRDLRSFSTISASEGIDVFLLKGTDESARVVINSGNIELDDVLTEVSGSRLKIHLDDGKGWTKRKNIDVEVFVKYKSLEGLRASSAASISAENAIDANGDFEIDVSSAGDIEVEINNVQELDIEASSAGDARLVVEAEEIDAGISSAGGIEISGYATTQEIDASSSGDYEGFDLKSKEVDASASSGGSVEVNVNDRLRARASSGGSVRYRGEPTNVNSDSSSGGSVKKS
ncbi:MAG: head GIN domain-containing protein [Bacteroidota bacterium]